LNWGLIQKDCQGGRVIDGTYVGYMIIQLVLLAIVIDQNAAHANIGDHGRSLFL
jgi:hypothetical protein